MPQIDDRPIAPSEKPDREARPIRAACLAATVAAMPLWLNACAPIAPPPPPPPAADISPPIIAEPTPGLGPIALAPSITGTPVPAPPPIPAPAVVTPEPLPPIPAAAVAMPPPPPVVPPAAPVAVVETPAAPSPCPPGQIATWSKPDMAGMPVLLCRRPR